MRPSPYGHTSVEALPHVLPRRRNASVASVSEAVIEPADSTSSSTGRYALSARGACMVEVSYYFLHP
jgi:hypothetical protein